jgi:hypothetical protein
MTANEKCSEARIRSRGPVTILAFAPFAPRGLNQSPGPSMMCPTSGLGLDLETHKGLGPRTSVVIDGQGFAAEDVVRYCECLGLEYRIGLQLKTTEAGVRVIVATLLADLRAAIA